MGKVAIYIETSNNEVKASNFGLITAAKKAGSEVYGLVLDGNAASYKDKLAEYGTDKVVAVATDQGTDYNPELYALAIVDAMKALDIHTFMSVTSARGKELLPRVSAELEAALVMDCMDVNLSDHTVTKSNFSGKVFAQMKLNGTERVYGVRPNSIPAEAASGAAEMVDHKAGVSASGKMTLKEVTASKAAGVDLTEAEVIISGGRAMGAADKFEVLQKCADVLGAAVGASRAAVDAGFATHDMQVGQTGKTVSPKLYIACGISGAIQHFAGMKTSKVIVAVNKDVGAPIFKKCDYGLVGDLFEVVPHLTEMLQKELG